MRVIVLVGIPGAGKTTVARATATEYAINHPGSTIAIVSADDEMVNESGSYCFDRRRLTECHGKTLLKASEMMLGLTEKPDLLIVDNTSCAAHEVAPYAELALATGAALSTLVLLCAPEKAASRGIHNVEAAHVYRRHLQLEREYPKFPPRWNVSVVWND